MLVQLGLWVPHRYVAELGQANFLLSPTAIHVVRQVVGHFQRYDRWWRQMSRLEYLRPDVELLSLGRLAVDHLASSTSPPAVKSSTSHGRRQWQPQQQQQQVATVVRTWWRYAFFLVRHSARPRTRGTTKSVGRHGGGAAAAATPRQPSLCFYWEHVRRAGVDRRAYTVAFRKRLQHGSMHSLAPVVSLSSHDQQVVQSVERRCVCVYVRART